MDFDTTDLTSYIPGYDEYIEPKEVKNDEEDIDTIVDEQILERLEKEKESD